jgi:hypothetical protein
MDVCMTLMDPDDFLRFHMERHRRARQCEATLRLALVFALITGGALLLVWRGT